MEPAASIKLQQGYRGVDLEAALLQVIRWSGLEVSVPWISALSLSTLNTSLGVLFDRLDAQAPKEGPRSWVPSPSLDAEDVSVAVTLATARLAKRLS